MRPGSSSLEAHPHFHMNHANRRSPMVGCASGVLPAIGAMESLQGSRWRWR